MESSEGWRLLGAIGSLLVLAIGLMRRPTGEGLGWRTWCTWIGAHCVALGGVQGYYEANAARLDGQLSTAMLAACDTCVTLSDGSNGFSLKRPPGQSWLDSEPIRFDRLFRAREVPMFDFAATVDERGIWLSGKFWNEKREVIVEVDRNRWLVNKNASQMNYDRTGLEIIDEHGVPILFVDLRPPCVIEVRGVFPIPGGFYIADEHGLRGYPVDSGRTAFEMYRETLLALPRRFKYPTIRFLGVRETPMRMQNGLPSPN